jgi:acetyl-CoA acetyltransferase
VGNFCSSGSTAFREAWIAVASGMYDVALAMGVEQLSVRPGKGKPLTSDGVELLTSLGFTPATFFANLAVRHMHEYGTTKEQIAMVAVKNRRNACFNSYAQYQEKVTIEEVLGSPMIVRPLTLYSCCPTGDGGSAAVLCSKDIAKRFSSKPIDVAACA